MGWTHLRRILPIDDRLKREFYAEKDNREWLRWLRNEQASQFAPEEQHQPIKPVDYDHIENNDFLATNRFWVEGADGRRRRTDALLVLNGIPIVNAAAKTTKRSPPRDGRSNAGPSADQPRPLISLLTASQTADRSTSPHTAGATCRC